MAIRIEASFDDGSAEDWRIAELMDRYKIDTVFYIPVNWRKYNASRGVNSLSEDQVYKLNDLFEIGAHGIDHLLLTRATPEDITAEIHTPIDWWGSKNITVKKFCYPRGYYNEDIKKQVRHAGYESARTTRVAEFFNSDPYETHTTVHVGIDRKEYGTDWLTFAEQKLDEALARVDENPHYHFWGHGVEIAKNEQWDRFEKLLKYLDERT